MKLKDMHHLPAHMIRKAHQLSTLLFAEELGAFDLTAAQYATLVALADLPSPDITRLSDAIGFDKATIGSVIDRLEAKGLVSRQPSETDRRRKDLILTPSGRALIQEVTPKVMSVQRRLLERLPPQDQAEFLRLLDRMLQPD